MGIFATGNRYASSSENTKYGAGRGILPFRSHFLKESLTLFGGEYIRRTTRFYIFTSSAYAYMNWYIGTPYTDPAQIHTHLVKTRAARNMYAGRRTADSHSGPDIPVRCKQKQKHSDDPIPQNKHPREPRASKGYPRERPADDGYGVSHHYA